MNQLIQKYKNQVYSMVFRTPHMMILHSLKVTKNKHFWSECDEKIKKFFWYSGFKLDSETSVE